MSRVKSSLRTLMPIACALAIAVGGCSKQQTSSAPLEVADDTVCALDGMLLRDYPGPKAQIHYADRAPDFFCDTIEMFAMLLAPERVQNVTVAYTQDMAKADWTNPQGQWIDARQAFYVSGSDVTGSMGPTFASFARREDAEAFAGKHGGKVLRFGDVTADMVDLRGGAHFDKQM